MATALPLPNLDDRRWADLVEEGRSLIPFYAPEWTDHNLHDPGITLIELFAWLAEMDLFELNQIADAHRRKFLALAGIEPESPRPARALLALQLTAGQGKLSIPAGVEFEGRDAYGEPTRFRSTHALTAVPGAIAALLSERDGRFQNLTNASKRGEPITPFGQDAGPGSAFYLGMTTGELWPAGTTISLGFGLTDLDLAAGIQERTRISDEAAWARRDCEPLRPTDCCQADPHVATGDGEAGHESVMVLRHHDVRLIWEIWVGIGRWERLDENAMVRDHTRALSLPGRIELTLPQAPVPGKFGGVERDLVWLRVRIVRGRHDTAPVIREIAFNAIEVEQSVPTVTHLRIAPGIPIPPAPAPIGEMIALDLDLNAQGLVTRLVFGPAKPEAPAVRLIAYDASARTVSFEAAAIAAGTGGPFQDLIASTSPLVVQSIQVTSLERQRSRAWQVRPDWYASTRSDAHLVVDAGNGILTLGDGEHGRTAPPGSVVMAIANATRAEQGNLVAGAIDRISESPRNGALHPDLLPPDTRPASIVNVTPATGGAAAESIPSAIARARQEREQPLRAVTLDDHIALALETPGARIARAEARANFHPGFPCLTAPGIITVLILPYLPENRPEPTPGLRHLVAAYLGRRRVIGTRVEVAGPAYVPVTVRAAVAAQAGWRAGELAAAISSALDRFFHPLHGGPDGSGWPFGRDVYRSEVLQVIDEVPGVAHVRSLELIKGDDPPTCGNLCVGPIGLVDAGAHDISVTRGNAK